MHYTGSLTMKTASIPSLRIDPALRNAVESVLVEGETLSSFVEQAVRGNVTRRQQQQAFIARGLAGWDDARRTGQYIDAADVLEEIDSMLSQVESGAGRS
jgi:predicted transcriptional regulator